MKERLTRNLWIKLLSLFCAFFVWLAVVNIANPIVTATQEIEVEIVNDSILERANLAYEVVGKKTATISYKIRTKDAYRLRDTDFRAYVDLSEMYDVTGAIPIRVEVLKNKDLLESAPVVKAPEVLKIQTEDILTKSFALEARPAGTPGEGCQPGTISIIPSQVSVRGPVSLMGQISSVGIEFDVEGATADVSGMATPVYYDANGNVLKDLGESVRTLSGDVSYSMQILKVREIPLDFVVSGEVAAGYRYTGAEASLRTISVAGLKSDLASLNTITIQDPALNIQGATQDKVCQIDLADHLDPKLSIAGLENTVVEITLRVERLSERSFTAEAKDITLAGQEDSLSYSLGDSKAEIRVRGLKEDLDSLSVDKMNIQADVTGRTPGVHTVTAQIRLDDAFEVIASSPVTVTVAEADRPNEAEGTQEAAAGAGPETEAETAAETEGETQ